MTEYVMHRDLGTSRIQLLVETYNDLSRDS